MNMVIEHDTMAAAGATARAAELPHPANRMLPAMPAEYLCFRVGSEEYGIDILHVQEIRRYEQPTRIAKAPPHVKGVVNLRGVIVPIVDLRLTLACDTADHTDLTVVIVLTIRSRVIGAVVDSVSDVLALGANNIKPAPSLDAAQETGHIMGIGSVNTGGVERMLILLDILALMSSPDLGLITAP